MKIVKQIKIGNETHDMYFTIGDLRKIEREIGKSLISTVLGLNQATKINIDFMLATMRYGFHDKIRNDDELYDLLDAYCADGKHSLDTLGAEIVLSVYDTGFFIPRKRTEKEKPPSKKTSKV